MKKCLLLLLAGLLAAVARPVYGQGAPAATPAAPKTRQAQVIDSVRKLTRKALNDSLRAAADQQIKVKEAVAAALKKEGDDTHGEAQIGLEREDNYRNQSSAAAIYQKARKETTVFS